MFGTATLSHSCVAGVKGVDVLAGEASVGNSRCRIGHGLTTEAV